MEKIETTEFPVTWDDPAEANFSWFFDMVHFPDQVTPLDFHFLIKTMEKGINRAAQIYEMGFKDHYRFLNTYVYDGPEIENSSPEEMTARTARSQQKLDAAIANLDQHWKDEWLPEIKEHISYWEGFNPSEVTMPILLEHLSETDERLQRMWEIHFLLFWPMVLALNNFEDMYQDIFGDSDRFKAYELLGGFENKTIEGNQILWQLSRKALASPIVRGVLTENAAADVTKKMAESVEGQTFLADLNHYLQEYGKQSDKPLSSSPSWLEDPIPVIKNLKNYITQPDQDRAAEMEKATVRREQQITQAYEALEDYPQPVINQFENFLKAAQVSYVLSEDHHFWIDCKVSYYARQVCLEFGRRLSESGVIKNQDDVFYLSLEEIKTAATTASSLQTLVSERRATERKFATCTPPPFLGAPFPEEMFDDPFYRALEKFFGVMASTGKEEQEMKGYAGSPGIVRGTARIIHTLDEADKLQSGDILVTKTTTPSWTSLFASVAAVVTNSGGSLSHSAIVAREYGIPAVVGTGTATTTIKEGQIIEVNGDSGLVRFL
jgi:pyruvate,water dikinase